MSSSTRGLQELNIGIRIDLDTIRNEDHWTLLAIRGDDPQDHAACRMLSCADRCCWSSLVHNDPVIAAVVDLVDGEDLLVGEDPHG